MEQEELHDAISSDRVVRGLNPFQMRPVINCILDHLSFRDFKKCRQLNKLWKSISEPILRRRCKIIFGRMMHKSQGTSPKYFMETFRNSVITIKFTSFSFKGEHCYWLSEVDQFFKIHKYAITDLTFEGTVFINDDGTRKAFQDISQWVKYSSITSLNIDPSHQVGRFDSHRHPPTQLIVCLAYLKCIKILKMKESKIIMEETDKISPATIELTGMTILHKGTVLKECLVNNFIKFNSGTTATFRSWPHREQVGTVFGLDCSENIVTKQISFEGISQCKNWRWSSSTIDKFVMPTTSVLYKNAMKVKFLCLMNAAVDLAAIPDSVETLILKGTIVDQLAVPILCSEPVRFTNLTHFGLDCLRASFMSYFNTCSNLVEITVTSSNRDDFEDVIPLNLTLLPNTVQKLNIPGSVRLEGTLTVETLTIHRACIGTAATILLQIAPKSLYLDVKGGRHNDVRSNLIPFVNNLEDIDLYIGVLESRALLRFRKLVDNIFKKYYFFKNKKGKWINESDFKKICFGTEELLFPTD